MTKLKWQQGMPKSEGWYWHRCDDGVESVSYFAFDWDCFITYDSGGDVCKWTADDRHVWWAGPIELPE